MKNDKKRLIKIRHGEVGRAHINLHLSTMSSKLVFRKSTRFP